MHIRSAMYGIGGKVLGLLVNADEGGCRGRTTSRDGCQQYGFIEYRHKKLLTVLGLVTVKRAYYYDREHRREYCPKDLALDTKGTSYNSGVRRMMCKVGPADLSVVRIEICMLWRISGHALLISL